MKYLFILILCLIGCGFQEHYGQEYTVYIDPAFGDKTEEVINGAEDWANKSNGILTIYIVIGLENSKKPGDIVVYAHTVADIPNVCSAVPLVGQQQQEGCTRRDVSDTANIRLGTDTKYFKGNVRHELGHAFGLEHDYLDNYTIMYPVANKIRPDYISCKDIFQYAMLRNIISPCK